MKWMKEDLEKAHLFSLSNKKQISQSKICGCFYCGFVFPAADLTDDDWTIDVGGPTALCPSCMIDSVIGDASGYPIEDERFMSAMNQYFFEGQGVTISREKAKWTIIEEIPDKPSKE